MARKDHYRDPGSPADDPAHDNDLYAIPGGGQEIGETISATVVREVKEETGIDVEATGLIGIYSDPDMSSRLPTARSGRSSRSAFAPARSAVSCGPVARARKY